MANTQYQYVRKFEEQDPALLNTYIVIRIDGRGFTKFCKQHEFEKPNDARALGLMNKCAIECFAKFPEILLGFGQSDEYNFAFRRDCKVFNRRKSKILSCIVSLFSSAYVFYWKEYMGDTPLLSIPQFDGRVTLYPTFDNLMDYFRWRQADCHINNMYNTCFWKLVNSGMSNKDAEKELCGTFSKDKHELLFSRFNTNYNNEPEMFKKGSVIVGSSKIYNALLEGTGQAVVSDAKLDSKGGNAVLHIDIMKQKFWDLLKPHC